MPHSIPPLLINHQRPLPTHLIFPPIAAVTAGFSILLVLSLCLRKIRRERTVPADSKPPHLFSYSILRRATSSFSASRRLGQGGFGSVYRATIPNNHHHNNNQTVAVKVMDADAGSFQGEREFQNELFFATKLDPSLVISVLGFSYDRKLRRMLLVYELMPNGNLQDALLNRKRPELMNWKQRFSIAVDIAKGLEYLHGLDPPVIHGDVKPSNILLDQYFSAKIADFGLARLKSEEIKVEIAEDNGSVAETESVATGIEEFNLVVDQSPASVMESPENAEVVEVAVSPETVGVAVAMSPEMMEKGSVSEGNFDRASVESGKELMNGGKQSGKGKKSGSGRDWWWKQDNGTVAESGKVKDYVMEWIGTEIKERPSSDWIASVASSSSEMNAKLEKKSRKRLEWWVSMEDDKEKNVKKEKRRSAREWWKEEYCEELAKKNKKKKRQLGMYHSDDNGGGENWWPVDDELYTERKKKSKRSRSRGSVGSVDWLWDGLSGELWRARRNSYDSLIGEIPKSGGISSTHSMRGTVCYIAPEYGGGGDISEKCDVYSFGVLMLVLIAGRRPLQVTGSPMSKFQRANLISWVRHLAQTGKLIDLVDQSIQSLNKEQALLCITVALLCLQKSPACRPSMKEVVGILTGEADPPQLPTEFSPSPPSRFPFKSGKKVR